MYANSKEVTTTSQKFADVCSLKPDMQYVFEVQAKSVKGTGPRSEKEIFRTAKPSKGSISLVNTTPGLEQCVCYLKKNTFR